jgi:hypothetical protein
MRPLPKNLIVGDWCIFRSDRQTPPVGFERKTTILRFTDDNTHYIEFPDAPVAKTIKFCYVMTPIGVKITRGQNYEVEIAVTEEMDGVLKLQGTDGRCDWIRRI